MWLDYCSVPNMSSLAGPGSGEGKGECRPEVGHFILFLPQGSTLQTLYPSAIAFPTPHEKEIPSREPSLDVGTDL